MKRYNFWLRTLFTIGTLLLFISFLTGCGFDMVKNNPNLL